jgi:hypothetical protein
MPLPTTAAAAKILNQAFDFSDAGLGFQAPCSYGSGNNRLRKALVKGRENSA